MSKIDKEELEAKLRNLEGLDNDEKAELIKLLREQKKYGLVWEESTEDVLEEMKSGFPVLEEVNLYISHSLFQHKFRLLKHLFHRVDLFDKEKSCVPSVKSYSSHTEMLRR